jgi:DUF1680 family protein
MERVITRVIPYQWEALNDRIPGAEPSYCMRNFKLAAQMTRPELDYGVSPDAGHGGWVFQDSDLAKWIEAASYSLAWRPDGELEKTIDGAIGLVCAAQQEDGYLDTYYIITGLSGRFTNLKDNHELYCMGHFIEAALAYHEVSGKRKLLDALIRFVDCVDHHIGPEEGKLPGYPGHEIAEWALIRLYRLTGEEKHLRLARYFIDQRGREPLFFEEEDRRRGIPPLSGKARYDRYQYHQAALPVREQRTAEGHAVRAVYLYTGMAAAARLTGDGELLAACQALFADITQRQMYLTGGIGQTCHGEAFSFDYDLPNDTAYGETCAAIGLAFFARELAALSPRGIYADTLERALYNGIISGMSLDGTAFFYVNPLEALPKASLKDPRMRHVKVERQKWFGCACCPPNLARIIASLGGYVHSFREDALYTHLYIGGEARFSLGGRGVRVETETSYPWEGRVELSFTVEGDGAEFAYGLRIPGWCPFAGAWLNGEELPLRPEEGYALVRRRWKTGDRLRLDFAMPVTVLEARPQVRQDAGRVAVSRGPLIYWLEEADNGGELGRLRLTGDPCFAVEEAPEVLGGVRVIRAQGKRLKDWPEGERLYRPREEGAHEEVSLRFIPYYAWANRGPGEMTVWLGAL